MKLKDLEMVLNYIRTKYLGGDDDWEVNLWNEVGGVIIGVHKRRPVMTSREFRYEQVLEDMQRDDDDDEEYEEVWV